MGWCGLWRGFASNWKSGLAGDNFENKNTASLMPIKINKNQEQYFVFSQMNAYPHW